MLRRSFHPIHREGRALLLRGHLSSSVCLWHCDAARRGPQHGTQSCSPTDHVKPFGEIPGPSRHWLVRGIRSVTRGENVFSTAFKRQEQLYRKFGPVIKVGRHDFEEVWIANPTDVATVLRADPPYPNRGMFSTGQDFYKRFNKEAGVFFLNGEKWHKHKSVLGKRMLRPPEINKYIPALDAIANEMILRISQKRNPEGHNRQFEIDNVDQELFNFSFESVTRILFDRRFGAIDDNPPPEVMDFKLNISEFLHHGVAVSILPPMLYKFYDPRLYKKFTQSFLAMYTYTERLIQEKMDQLDQKMRNSSCNFDTDESQEFIPYLLASKKIEPHEIVSSIVDTLFAGVDTTSNTMQWMLYLLSRNPDKQEVLRKEVDKFTETGNQLTPEILSQLSYLKAVIKETLRLYPVLLTNSRILAKDLVLSGYHVPARKKVVFMNHVMGRSHDLFDSPNNFLPERWLRDSKDFKIISFSSIPFGHGVRMCLGKRLAELELQILMVKIMQIYHLQYTSDEVVKQYFRGTTAPDRPIRVTFEKRK